MQKIPSISEMENFLLSKSSTDDFVFNATRRSVPHYNQSAHAEKYRLFLSL